MNETEPTTSILMKHKERWIEAGKDDRKTQKDYG